MTLYVDCDNGSDSNTGSSPSSALQTPNRARDLLRATASTRTGTATVEITGDCYPRNSSTGNKIDFSVPVLSLEAPQDSGSSEATRITYMGQPTARFMGGMPLPADQWKPDPDRSCKGAVMMDVSAALPGVVFPGGYGSLKPGSLGQCAAHALVELFWNNTAMTLARYPNIMPNGTWAWMNIDSVVNVSTFNIVNLRPLRWVGERDPWLSGFWAQDWAQSYVQPVSIKQTGTNETTITTSSATPPVYSYTHKARVMGVNLLSELDAPGEYYLDRTASMLYFCPPNGNAASSESVLSVGNYIVTLGVPSLSSSSSSSSSSFSSSSPLFSSSFSSSPSLPAAHAPHALMGLDPILENTAGKLFEYDRLTRDYLDPSYSSAKFFDTSGASSSSAAASALQFVTLKNLGINFARSVGVYGPSVNNVQLVNLDVSNHGQNAVLLTGLGNLVSGIKAWGTGCAAVSVTGGQVSALTPGNNVVQDSDVAFYARITRVYNPGLIFSGVGNTYTRNTVHDAPHQAIFGSGNNHLFSFNHVYDVCYEATDSSAWYMGRSWAERGNTITNNIFERVQSVERTFLGAPYVQGVYCDDQLSETFILNNTFINCTQGILLGGGRDSILRFNSFDGCLNAIAYDNRGMGWQASSCYYNKTNPSASGVLVLGLFAVNYLQPPYSEAYPSIVNLLDNHPCVPVNNTVTDNTYCNIERNFLTATDADFQSWYDPPEVRNVKKC